MSTEWIIVPVNRKDMHYFDRQRDLFKDWVMEFDDENWRKLKLDESRQRFERELEKAKEEMHNLKDSQSSALQLDRPFITDPSGNKKFALRVDVSSFKPEEIHVKTMDNKLTVSAVHDEETSGAKVHKEFNRSYILPDKVDPVRVTSTLSKDGVLHIEAPAPWAPHAPKEFLIPIEKM